MAKLTSDVQAFVVQQLACFLTLSEVFGVEISRQQAWKYSPENNPELAPKWRTMFDATREAFVREAAQIGIAHRSYRLRRLESYLRRAEAKIPSNGRDGPGGRQRPAGSAATVHDAPAGPREENC